LFEVILLVQGGFVHQEMAGVYSWLPLGLRVMRKVEAIVREEMDALGAQEVLMSGLQPKENWLQTDRWDKMDVLFKIPSQTKKEYALGPTHEEIVTPLVKAFVTSYKDLPVAVYQIQTKFRDELRAKSGVLRGREFNMKDLYSFHLTQADLEAFYQKALQAYLQVFSRCGLQAKVVEASGGAFTKKFSHEFQVLTDAGEDKILTSPSWMYGQNSEVATLKEGDACPDHPGEVLEWRKGVEVGNIFDLGPKFAEAFDLVVTNEAGERQPVLMGCYGIGVSRLVGTIVEACHDDRGIVWPRRVAPYQVEIVSLRSKDEAMQTRISETALALYEDLTKQGVEVLWDDRADVSPGEKFADADLLGMPLRLVVSEKMLKENSIEWKERAKTEAQVVKMEDVVEMVGEFVK
jgi:prolyl-tRNA synthetase